jgi:hypothetical protein
MMRELLRLSAQLQIAHATAIDSRRFELAASIRTLAVLVADEIGMMATGRVAS